MKRTPRQQPGRAPIARLVSSGAAIGAASLLFATAAGASSPLTVNSQTVGKVGKVLVVDGKAAYVLSPAGTKCTGLCLKIWPAVSESAKSVKAGSGVQQSKLGTTSGPSGTHQVTYGGQKLYFFSGDSKGTVHGDITDQFGKWTAVVVAKAKGSTGSGAGTGTSSNTGGGANAGGGGVNF